MNSEGLSDLRQRAIADHRAGKADSAMQLYTRYLGLVPEDGLMWTNFGVLCRSQKLLQMARRAQERAFALTPDAAGVRGNYANILSDLGAFEQSIALRQDVLAVDPSNAEQIALIGKCLRGLNRYDEAIAYMSRALPAHAAFADLELQLAMTELAAGRYRDGFRHYRSRWHTGEIKPRDLPIPYWTGQPLTGKRVVVMPEQGFGDCVLIARFLPHLKALGAEVTLLAERPLLRLVAAVEGADHVVSKIDILKFDYWLNLMDLPTIALRTDAEMRPPSRLTVPEEATARARRIVAPYRDKFRVGVVWTGSTGYRGNHFRSLSHTDFLPLSDIAGVQLFSLYKGPGLAELVADGSAAVIVNAAHDDSDFADCAGLMQELDLVITSDTATAHIAGSLGLPTWVLLHNDPFWVFRHTGERTPWYPSVRLFRQTEALNWTDVMAQVATALRGRMQDHD